MCFLNDTKKKEKKEKEIPLKKKKLFPFFFLGIMYYIAATKSLGDFFYILEMYQTKKASQKKKTDLMFAF